MKSIILSITIYLASTTVLFSQENHEPKDSVTLNWASSFKEAQQKSKKEKKPILIFFTGSDWCGPCKVLNKKLFHTEKFKAMADKDLILYEADDPRNKNLIAIDKLEANDDLKRKYRINAYPSLVFVNHRGKMIGIKKGLILTEYYYPFIESIVENY